MNIEKLLENLKRASFDAVFVQTKEQARAEVEKITFLFHKNILTVTHIGKNLKLQQFDRYILYGCREKEFF